MRLPSRSRVHTSTIVNYGSHMANNSRSRVHTSTIVNYGSHMTNNSRSRVHTSTIVNYGSHMAVHMAAGLLFLGGGKYGLASTPLAVASLIIAFFPKECHVN